MLIDYEIFTARVDKVRERIARAAAAAGRSPEDVKLLPITKTHPAEAAAYAARYGLPAVGENRVQEAIEKQPLVSIPLRWELVGHLQSNKTRLAAAHFHRIQSVDSEKLVRHLGRAAAELSLRLPVLLQINAGLDPAKFGAGPEQAPRLLEAALSQPHLLVEGLMAIPPLSDDPEVARCTFVALRRLRDELAVRFGVPLAELSMGMTADLEIAVAEGSTLVRVGTALYGPRE